MKILVDLLSLGTGGGVTYLCELLPRVAAYPHDVTILLRAGSAERLRSCLPAAIRVMEAPASTANPLWRFWYQRYRIPRIMADGGMQVLFVPGGVTGTRGTNGKFKVVTMLQNMLPFNARERARHSFLSYPKTRFRLGLLSWGLRASFRHADRVIFISQYSAGVVAPQLSGVDSRIIPHGVPTSFLEDEPAQAELPKRYGITKPYLLYVSPTNPYKHQDKVLEGFGRFRRRNTRNDLQLVLAGLLVGAYGRRVKRAAELFGDAVVCTGDVPTCAVPGLVRQATVLLFASTCETCPFILLEYLGAGKPIISSQAPPMPEFGGEAVRYVNAEDPEAWAAELTRLLTSPADMKQLGERAKAQAQRYSWENTVRDTVGALTEW